MVENKHLNCLRQNKWNRPQTIGNSSKVYVQNALMCISLERKLIGHYICIYEKFSRNKNLNVLLAIEYEKNDFFQSITR